MEERVAVLTATAADLDARFRKKQDEVTDLQKVLVDRKRDAEGALAGQAELRAHIETLNQEKASIAGERDANALTIKQVHAELDGLRNSMAEKLSQDRLKANLDKSKDLELNSLRVKLESAVKQAAADRQSSASSREKLEACLEDVRRQNTSLARDHKEAQSALALAKARFTDLSVSVAAFEDDRRSLQSQLSEMRSRQIATDGQLAEASKERAVSNVEDGWYRLLM
jgi:chromosome segregation ATPase